VEFLELVSSWGVDDLVGGHRRWFRIDHDAFVQNRTRTFKAFANLPENITATRVIGKKTLERATATHIVQYALNCRIGEPLVLGVMVFDGLFHIILLFAYRFAVLEKDAQKSGISPSALLVYLPAVYFIGRDVLTLASIILSSKQILSLYLRNPWTYMDIMSVVMAAWTASDQSESQQIFGRSIAIAITIALLWFKLLGFLRYINKQLTTFIASFFEILGAIKWFFLVLMVAIMLFGDTIETILKFNNTCSEGDFEDSMSGAQADFCSPQPMESYLRIYSVVIGDVSLDDFQQTTFIKSLFFFFTFFGIIVLLNILIAIVNDSYSRAIMRSNGLFGKARMELVVRQLAREYFTVPKFVDEESQHLCSIWTIRKIFGFFLKFTVMSIIVSVEVCLIIFTSSFVNNFVAGKQFFGVIFMAVTTVYTFALVVMSLLCFDKYSPLDTSKMKVFRFIHNTLESTLAPVRHALAVDTSMQETSIDFDNLDDWAGHLKYLEVKTMQVVEKSADHLRSDIKAEFKASEERQRLKLNTVVDSIASLITGNK